MSSESTPWPITLAFGLAVAELGVFLGFAAVAATLPIRGYSMLIGAALLLPLAALDRRR